MERKIFNSWLNNKPSRYLYRLSNVKLYLFQINTKVMETLIRGAEYFIKFFQKENYQYQTNKNKSRKLKIGEKIDKYFEEM